jgi:hypothetical protein
MAVVSSPSISSSHLINMDTYSRSRSYHLEIENYHHGPEDGSRTRFVVRGETVDEVLQNIIDNTLVSFATHEVMFRKIAHLYDRRFAALGKKELLPGQPMPAGVESIYLYFRPAAAAAPSIL